MAFRSNPNCLSKQSGYALLFKPAYFFAGSAAGAIAAGAAADAASVADAAGAGAGAGAATAAAAAAGASAGLWPQAVREIASRAATRMEIFMVFSLSKNSNWIASHSGLLRHGGGMLSTFCRNNSGVRYFQLGLMDNYLI